ncbi:uncharacterized protein TNCV_3568941 [Trichonephila clavipes]|nr:uncharacterized protein TNCV_3568941 [Trichonephila clavipes]
MSESTFFRRLKQLSNTPIGCPQCRDQMTLSHFYHKHASQKHVLNFRKQCVFCFGNKHWKHGERKRPDNINHVVSCLERFTKDDKDVWVFSEEEEEIVEMDEKACRCRYFLPMPREMYGRRKVREGF